MSIRSLKDLEKDGWKVSPADKYLAVFTRFQADLQSVFKRLGELLMQSASMNRQSREATASLERTIKAVDQSLESTSRLVDKATSALVRTQRPVVNVPEPVVQVVEQDDTGAQWECLVERDRINGRIRRVLITKVREG